MAEKTLTTITPAAVESRLRHTIASQDLEGLASPPEEQAMLRRLSRGEVSLAEYEQWAKGTYIGGS